MFLALIIKSKFPEGRKVVWLIYCYILNAGNIPGTGQKHSNYLLKGNEFLSQNSYRAL